MWLFLRRLESLCCVAVCPMTTMLLFGRVDMFWLLCEICRKLTNRWTFLFLKRVNGIARVWHMNRIALFNMLMLSGTRFMVCTEKTAKYREFLKDFRFLLPVRAPWPRLWL